MVEAKMEQMRLKREHREASAEARMRAEVNGFEKRDEALTATHLARVQYEADEQKLAAGSGLSNTIPYAYADVLPYTTRNSQLNGQRIAIDNAEIAQVRSMYERMDSVHNEEGQMYAQQVAARGLDHDALELAPDDRARLVIVNQWFAQQGASIDQAKILWELGLSEENTRAQVEAAVEATKKTLLEERAAIIKGIRENHVKDVSLLKSEISELHKLAGSQTSHPPIPVHCNTLSGPQA